LAGLRWGTANASCRWPPPTAKAAVRRCFVTPSQDPATRGPARPDL